MQTDQGEHLLCLERLADAFAVFLFYSLHLVHAYSTAFMATGTETLLIYRMHFLR